MEDEKMTQLTKNFTEAEFACPCCGEVKMNQSTLNRNQELRDRWGKPYTIAKGGGYRCPDYDNSKGAHPLGMGIDPMIARQDMYAFVKLAMLCGFTGIGVKQKSGRWQVHMDDAPASPSRPRPWMWTY